MIDDQWRKEYRDRKYLENLSNDELLQRGRAVFRNFMTINARGQASPLPINHRLHGYWRSRFVHFLEECVCRFGPFPNGLGDEFVDGLKFPKPRSKRIVAARGTISQNQYEDGKHLFKFGRREHLEAMLRAGI